MKAKEIEVALSVLLTRWCIERNPDEDVETTLLEEMGEADTGILLTVGSEEFRITVEPL